MIRTIYQSKRNRFNQLLFAKFNISKLFRYQSANKILPFFFLVSKVELLMTQCTKHFFQFPIRFLKHLHLGKNIQAHHN